MFNISSFLGKFSEKIEYLSAHKKRIIDIVKKQADVDMLDKDLQIKNNIIYTTSSPAVKNKIFISKGEIINQVLTETGVNIVDVR